MPDENSMDDVIKKQKEDCIFCKIISGKVNSVKLYDDDLVIALMDINPAVEGHVLLMPKEHYPIAPLIPRNTFEHMFKVAKYISRAMRDSLGALKTSIFVANGGVAGQQSMHFMMHIFPRFAGDILSNLDAIGNCQEDVSSFKDSIGPNLGYMVTQLGSTSESVSKYLNTEIASIEPSTPERKTPSPASSEQKKKISELFNSNDEFKDLILNRTDDLKELIKTNERWSALFSGIDVDALSKKLIQMGKLK